MRDWLIELRGKRSQESVAKAVGISQQGYCWYEIGSRRPCPEIAMALGKELGFDWKKFYETSDTA